MSRPLSYKNRIEAEYIFFINKMTNNLVLNKFKLNDDDITWVKDLITDVPETLHQIIHELQHFQGMKLNLHDIPKLVMIITQIYDTVLMRVGKTKIEYKKMVVLIKFTIDTIIDSILPLPDVEKHIIETIVNSSIDLVGLKIRSIERKVQSCWNICSDFD